MKSKFVKSSIVFGLSVFVLAACMKDQTPSDWVVKINNNYITESAMNLRWLNVSPEIQKQINNPVNFVLNDLIKKEIFFQEASKEGLNNSDDYKGYVKRLTDQYEYQKRQALVDLYLREKVENSITITDQEVASAYDANKDRFFSGFEQRAFSHILVADEAAAKSILKELSRGVSYDDLAKTKSIDVNTAKNGGRLNGYYRKEVLNPSLASAIFGMKNPGQVSKPVKSQAGYHIVRLDDVQQVTPRSFDQVKGYLKQQLYIKKRNDELAKLFTSVKDGYKQSINPKNKKTEEAPKKEGA